MDLKRKNRSPKNLKMVQEQENLLSLRGVHFYPGKIKIKLRRNAFYVHQTVII